MVTLIAPRKTAGTASTSGTLARGFHTPVDATSTSLVMSLPTNAPVGVEISVERVDASANVVTISGTLRGSVSSITLTSQYESRTFLSEGGGSWRPTSDHRTKASLDAAYLAASTRGAALGIAPLDAASKVPAANLPAGVDPNSLSLRPVGTATSAARLPFINLKDYLAVGNNSTDDTAAIQAAIDAAAAFASTTGAVVWCPPGLYRVSTINLKSKVYLVGGSRSSVVFKQLNGVNAHVIQLADGRQEQIGLVNITIDGNKANQSPGGLFHGIYIHNDSATAGVFPGSGYNNPHHYIDNVHVRYCVGDGVFTDGDMFGGAIHMTNTFAYGCGRYGFNLQTPDSFYSLLDAGGNGNHGFNLLAANCRLVGCKAWYSGGAAGAITTTTACGFYAGSSAKRIHLIGCEAQDNAFHGFSFDGSTDSIIEGGISDSNGTAASGTAAGFALLNGANLNTVTGRTFNRPGADTTTQPFGLRLDTGVQNNIISVGIGSVTNTGLSGVVGNNRVTINRFAGGNRDVFPSSIEFGADNTYDLGTTTSRPRHLILGGGITRGLKYAPGSGVYTVATTDDTVFAPAGSTGVQLPTPVGASGRRYAVKNLTSGALPVTSAVGNVENVASYSLAAGAGATFVSDNSGWWIVA